MYDKNSIFRPFSQLTGNRQQSSCIDQCTKRTVPLDATKMKTINTFSCSSKFSDKISSDSILCHKYYVVFVNRISLQLTESH